MKKRWRNCITLAEFVFGYLMVLWTWFNNQNIFHFCNLIMSFGIPIIHIHHIDSFFEIILNKQCQRWFYNELFVVGIFRTWKQVIKNVNFVYMYSELIRSNYIRLSFKIFGRQTTKYSRPIPINQSRNFIYELRYIIFKMRKPTVKESYYRKHNSGIYKTNQQKKCWHNEYKSLIDTDVLIDILSIK